MLASQWSPDRRSGYARVVGDTSRGLARLGHDVTAIVPQRDGPAARREDGVEVHRALPRGPLPDTVHEVTATARAANAIGAGRPGAFDVVVAHSSTTAVAARLAGIRAPIAYVFHASAARELRFDRPRLSPAHRVASYPLVALLAALEGSAVRAASSILVLSEFSRRIVAADHPGVSARVELVSGGVDTDAFRPEPSQDEARAALAVDPHARLLVTARRLEPRMGLENLVAAVADLPGVSLSVVGSGSLRDELRARIARLGLTARVQLAGAVTDEELRLWLRAADLFVLPTVAYEGFGIATAEALACGTPVVGTPVGATPELIEPVDRTLVAGSPEAGDLARAIDAALARPAAALAERSRAVACERLSWTRVLPRWERALAAAAAGP